MSSPSSQVLMLGGTRFFGREIVRSLLDSGIGVTMFTRGQREASYRDSRVEWLTGDRKDPDALRELVRGRRFRTIIDNICYEPGDACMACDILAEKADRYIFTSSVMTYLNGYLNGEVLSESDWRVQASFTGMLSQYNPGELTYANNKRACESVFLERIPDQVLIFRLHNVVGIDDFSGKSGAIVSAVRRDGKCRLPGHPEDTLQLILANDVGRIYRDLATRKEQIEWRAVNVALKPISQNEFVQYLLENTPYHVNHVEYSGDQRPWGAAGVTAPFARDFRVDVTRLNSLLDWNLTSCDAFAPQMGRWYADRSIMT